MVFSQYAFWLKRDVAATYTTHSRAFAGVSTGHVQDTTYDRAHTYMYGFALRRWSHEPIGR